MRQALPNGFSALCFALILAFSFTAGRPASAAAGTDASTDPSSGIKIYRAVSREGTPIMVLTNLDEEGNRLPSPGGPGIDTTGTVRQAPACVADDPGRTSTGPGEADRASGAPAGVPSGQVRVVVNQGEGQADPGARDVEVTGDGSGGTTVIININPPAPPEKEIVVVPSPFTYPVVAYGGLPGGFRYPDHLPFLGYGPGTSSPSWFGGLVLNAGNGFGLKTGRTCGRGYDCMLAPSGANP